MLQFAVYITFFLATGLFASAQTQVGPPSPPQASPPDVPLYRLSFSRGETVPGISSTLAIRLPFECTSDGVIFVSFISGVPVGSGLPPLPPGVMPTQLTSIPRTGAAHTFRLDQIPDLYVSRDEGDFASDSEVVLLVRASRENKPEKHPYAVGSYHGEYTRNAAEQHLFILVFDRDGNYKRFVEPPETLEIEKLAVFSSGTFLAFGFDKKDHSPKLVMLKEDGAFLKSLEIPKGDAPTSLISADDAKTPHAVLPSQLVMEGRSILLAQTGSAYPLLEVDEGGSVWTIRPKLPKGEQIEAVIPSNRDIYLIAGPEAPRDAKATVRGSEEKIYQVSRDDGSLRGRFAVTEERMDPDSVACVNDGKFLSIDYADGKVVPLIGSPEPTLSRQGNQP